MSIIRYSKSSRLVLISLYNCFVLHSRADPRKRRKTVIEIVFVL